MTRTGFDITARSAARRGNGLRALTLAALMALAMGPALVGCGKKGNPEPPAGAEETVYPRPYPDPKTY
ncbi:MAG: hypothetical protein OEO83_05490 [Alphaproteobacteria bacterium]|nr:hypothetical protein [Alphaproteobacteria bacterium]